MTQKTKILLLLASASALVFAYLIISSRPLVMDGAKDNGAKTAIKGPTEPGKAVDLQEVAVAHKTEMTKILDDYASLVNEISADGGIVGHNSVMTAGMADERENLLRQAEELKSRISGLKAPTAEHKDTHLNLVLSIDRIENFINDGDEGERENGLMLLARARQDFELLSNGRN
jgi:hypothetical protein